MLIDIPSWPTTLQIATGDKTTPLICEKPLRNLPGKRLVCRGTLQGQSVLIKLFLHPQRARHHWQREKDGVDLLTDNHLTTPTLVFTGTLDDKTPVLIFDYLQKGRDALDIYKDCTNDSDRLTFLNQLVEVIAAQHQCGIWQQDLHLENFLISDDVIYSIDGDGIRSSKKQGMSIQQRRDNLALFLAQLPPHDEHLFTEIIHRYITNSIDIKGSNWSAIIDEELPRSRDKRRHNYVNKCYRTCSEFVHHNSFRKISIYRRDIQPEQLHLLLDNPDALMADGTILKNGNSATVVRVQVAGQDWVIKRYNIKSFWHALKRCWRPTRAWVSWGNAHRLKISSIDTPQAVAMIEKRFGPLRLGGYYICEYVKAPDAIEYFSPSLTTKMEAAQQFVTLFDVLHKTGIYHGDCKGTNFLIEVDRPWIIDLDAMREFGSRQRYLTAFKVDRQRFLRNWQNIPNLQRWFEEHLLQ